MSHRSAAAFVDAEARMFLQDAPIGPGDRVMAGLSVAFDASCEEMWLAWRYGACLVPPPGRSSESGMDLGPWLVANDVTIVSTVPTLVTLWPTDALDDVRLLILGGEACPPEIGARLATATREVWNTYGPTEATVVACGARLTGEPPVRIGLPLDGWDLAIVDQSGARVPDGEPGELIIGGVGLARYLDPAKDATMYAAMPTLGWDRAYRSGDIVRFDGVGLVFQGRADDQVKVGGRRIELGEVDSALLGLAGVSGAAAAVRRTEPATACSSATSPPSPASTRTRPLEPSGTLHAGRAVPRLAVVDTLPTRTSGKIDRDALPWPLPNAGARRERPAPSTARPGGSRSTGAHPGRRPRRRPTTSSTSGREPHRRPARLRLRERFPEVTVADVYDGPSCATSLRPRREATPAGRSNAGFRRPRGDPGRPGARDAAVQCLRRCAGCVWIGVASSPPASCSASAWLPVATGAGSPSAGWPSSALRSRAALGCRRARSCSPASGPAGTRGVAGPPAAVAGRAARRRAGRVQPLGRAAGASCTPGCWAARSARTSTCTASRRSRACCTSATAARSSPRSTSPATGSTATSCTSVRSGSAPDARVGARSTLLPGADVGDGAEVAPGSAVFGPVPAGESWSGAPATLGSGARALATDAPAARRCWALAYAASAVPCSRRCR